MEMSIGNRIIAARERKRMSQSDVARGMHVTPQTVQQWESGKTAPARKRVEKLAALLDVTPELLQFGHKDEMTLAEPSVSYIAKPGSDEAFIRTVWRNLPKPARAQVLACIEVQLKLMEDYPELFTTKDSERNMYKKLAADIPRLRRSEMAKK